jgi:hypothetical protein
MGEAVAALLWGAVEVILIFTGKAVIAVASFGRWRSESLNGAEGRIYGPAGALSFKRDGQCVFTPTGLSLVGVLFYVLLVLALLWWASLP